MSKQKPAQNINRFRPVATHSLLLALEPRQVFDGAVGAAIAEVIENTAPNDQAENQPDEDQSETEALRLEGGAADQATVHGSDTLLSAVGGHEPALHLAPDALLTSGELDLSRVSVIDFDEGERHTLVLRAEGGRFNAPEGEGIFLEDEGQTLTFRNMTVLEINQALAACLFTSADPSDPAAAISYYIDDPLTDPVEGRFELAGGDSDPEPNEDSSPLLMRGGLFGPQGLGVSNPSASDPDLKLELELIITGDGETKYFPSLITNSGTAVLNGIEIEGEGTLRLTIRAEKTDGSLDLEGAFRINDDGAVKITNDGGSIILEGSAGAIMNLLKGSSGSQLSYLSDSSMAAHQVNFVFTLEKQVEGAWDGKAAVSHIVNINHPPTLTVKPEFSGTVTENSKSVTPPENGKDPREMYFTGIEVDDQNTGELLSLTLTLNDSNSPPLGRLHKDNLPAELRDKVDIDLAGQKLVITGATAEDINKILTGVYYKGESDVSGELTFSISVTDKFGGETIMAAHALTVTFVNDPPLVDPPTKAETGQHLSVYEGDDPFADGADPNTGRLTPAHFNIDDITLDKGKASDLDKIIITLESEPGQGGIYRNGVLLGQGATFSLKEVADGLIRYKHDGLKQVERDKVLEGTALSDLPMDSFRFSVNDGSGPVTTGRTVDAGGKLVISDTPLEIFINLKPVNKGLEVSAAETDADGGAVLWVWEDQQGFRLTQAVTGNVRSEAGFSLDFGDEKHGLSDILITVKTAPERGRLYLVDAEGKFDRWLQQGDTLSGDELQYLCFSDDIYAKNEPNPSDYPGFELTFTDHNNIYYTDRTAAEGYDFDRDKPLDPISVFFTIKIADNNDDPVLNKWGSIGNGPGEGERLVIKHPAGEGEHGSRFVPIDDKMLLVVDDDNPLPSSLTYTLTAIPAAGDGYLVRQLPGQAGYEILGLNATFSQADIDNGLIFFYANGTKAEGADYVDISTSFKFTVTDGGLNSWPDSSRHGGIYDYEKNADGHYLWDEATKAYKLAPTGYEGQRYVVKKDGGDKHVLKVHEFLIDVRRYYDEGSTPEDWYQNVKPEVKVDEDKVTLIYEGPEGDDDGSGRGSGFPHEIIITGGLMDGGEVPQVLDPDKGYWEADKYDQKMIYIFDPDTSPEHLTLSLDSQLTSGRLYIQSSDGWVELHYGGKFSYADLMSGKIKYVHSGGESFSEALRFKVSDCSNMTEQDQAYIDLNLKIVPYNDAPEITGPETATVVEGEYVYFQGLGKAEAEDKKGPEAGRISLSDHDGSGDDKIAIYDSNGKEIAEDFSLEPDKLFVTLTTKPAGEGTLEYYNTDLDTWVVWNQGQTISAEYFEAGLRYKHSGSEADDPSKPGKSTVNFTLTLSDEPAALGDDGQVVPGGSKSDVYSLTINVKALNNPPDIKGVMVDAEAKELAIPSDGSIPNPTLENGGRVIIWGDSGDDTKPININFTDQDNNTGQIFYDITEGCTSGKLYRVTYDDDRNIIHSELLSKGSTFTQADLDQGRIIYEHNGKNQHQDFFKFVVHDGSKYYNDSSDPAIKFAGAKDNAAPQTFNIDIKPLNEAPRFEGLGQEGQGQLEVLYEDDYNGVQLLDPNNTGKPGEFLQIKDLDQERGFDGTGHFWGNEVVLDIYANLEGYQYTQIDADGKAVLNTNSGLALGKFHID